MSRSTPNLRLRGAFETMIRLAAPGLDMLLLLAERASRVLDRGDHGYAIVRLQHDGESAPRGLGDYGVPASRSQGTQ